MMRAAKLTTLLGTMRLPFLLLSLVSVFLGLATAVSDSAEISVMDFILVLLGAVAAHISVNTLNEYSDYRSGLNHQTVKTPFSGGSGALLANPGALQYVLLMVLAGLAVTTCVGIYFLIKYGLGILPLGLIGIAIIFLYTNTLNRHPILCLVAPGLGFGPLMVLGTYYSLTGEYSVTAFVVSLLPFFLANNLLLLNQYPDILADQTVGRRHFPIVYGVEKSTILYGFFASLAALTIVLAIVFSVLPAACAIGIVPIVGAGFVIRGASMYSESVAQLVPYMALNVMISLLSPSLLGLGLIVG